LLAFWAFVGFENLTFLTSHLKDPGRDFLFICFTALGLYCALAIALTLAVSVRTNARDVDPVAGLLQIASGLPGEAIIVGAAVLTGVVAMLINAVSLWSNPPEWQDSQGGSPIGLGGRRPEPWH
jgi:amino acid transporter